MVECTVLRSQTLYHYLLQWQDLKNTLDNTLIKSDVNYTSVYFNGHTYIKNIGNLLKQIWDLDGVKLDIVPVLSLFVTFNTGVTRNMIYAQIMCS